MKTTDNSFKFHKNLGRYFLLNISKKLSSTLLNDPSNDEALNKVLQIIIVQLDSLVIIEINIFEYGNICMIVY